MKRLTLTILVIMITSIILIIICDILKFEKVIEYLSIITPTIFVLIGFSFFNKKCLEFWNKKIYFNK